MLVQLLFWMVPLLFLGRREQLLRIISLQHQLEVYRRQPSVMAPLVLITPKPHRCARIGDGAGRSARGRLFVNRRRLLKRLAEGALQNVSFADLVNLVEGFGFRLQRVSGSHHIFAHPDIPELVNLQVVRGEAKPYQIRQLLRLVERHNIELED
jgi:predicted RNA binding protein YcfA (HicA-like mRNA interferase family)